MIIYFSFYTLYFSFINRLSEFYILYYYILTNYNLNKRERVYYRINNFLVHIISSHERKFPIIVLQVSIYFIIVLVLYEFLSLKNFSSTVKTRIIKLFSSKLISDRMRRKCFLRLLWKEINISIIILEIDFDKLQSYHIIWIVKSKGEIL